MDESRVENLARASSENGTATVIGLNWARHVVQVSAAVCGEERCVTRQITAAWETNQSTMFVQISKDSYQRNFAESTTLPATVRRF